MYYLKSADACHTWQRPDVSGMADIARKYSLNINLFRNS